MAASTVRDALQWGANALGQTPSTTPRLDAEILLGHVTGHTRTQFMVWPDLPVSESDWATFARLIEERRGGVPIAYLTGRRAFLDIELLVGPGALVPRPETEMLVEWADSYLQTIDQVSERIVVDAGSGPGTILLALARRWEKRNVRFIGVDPSCDALKWAVSNREHLGLAAAVAFVQGDLLTWFGEKALLVTANLPYLRSDQIKNNWQLAAEPVLALHGGKDGLDLIARLLQDLTRVLADDGAIALEIDPSQEIAVQVLIRDNAPWLNAKVHRDLAGMPRLVTGTPRAAVDRSQSQGGVP